MAVIILQGKDIYLDNELVGNVYLVLNYANDHTLDYQVNYDLGLAYTDLGTGKASTIAGKYIYADSCKIDFIRNDITINKLDRIYDNSYPYTAMGKALTSNATQRIADLNTVYDNTDIMGCYEALTFSYSVEVDLVRFRDSDGNAKITLSGITDIPENIVEPNLTKCAILSSAPNFSDEENPTIIFDEIDNGKLRSGWAFAPELDLVISVDGKTDDVVRQYTLYEPTSGSYKHYNINYTFELTEEERALLRSKVTKGINTQVTFKVRTKIYVTSNITRQYESKLSKTFTLINAYPSIAPEVEDVDAKTLALTGDKNTFVRYYSDAKYIINAYASKGATITHQEASSGAIASTAPTGILENVEKGVFLFTAVDSRELIASTTLEKNFIEYIKLTCNAVKKSVSAEGDISFEISGNYFNGSFGATTNSLALKYRKKVNNEDYSEWVTVTPNISKDTYNATVEVHLDSYRDILTIQAAVEDKLDTIQSADLVIKVLPIFDWSENDFNFNIPVGYTEEGKNYSITETIKEASSLIKALTNSYNLTTNISAGDNYKNVKCGIKLFGNIISADLSFTPLTSGIVNNDTLCTVTFESQGKVVNYDGTYINNNGTIINIDDSFNIKISGELEADKEQ